MLTPAYAPTATERVLPRLALDFTTATLDARVTVTRALNTATRVNSSGLIAGVNADLPRFDYDPTTLACKGLLIEESRANAFTYSQDFGNAAWTPSILNVSTDAATSPDGTANADKLIPTTANGVHGTKQSAALSNGVAYTMSGFFKADGYRRVMLRESTAFGYAAVFDLISGTVISTTDSTAAITNFGNGWYRCEMRFTSGWTNTSDMYIFVLPDNGTGYGSATFEGNGTSGILAYGAQFETGAFATSYIPTTTTSLTRNADVVTMTGTNFSSWYNQSQGTFLTDFTSNGYVANEMLFSATPGDLSAIIQAYWTAATTISADGGLNASMSISGAQNTASKFIYAYALNNYAMSVNATSPATDLSGTPPSTLSQLNIGNRNGSLVGNQHIRKFSYWPQRLTNAEVQAFSK